MIRLLAPQWVEIGEGARVRLRPFNHLAALVAGEEVRAAAAADEDRAGWSEELRSTVLGIEVLDATIAAHVEAWDGIGDEEGRPVEPTRDLVANLLRSVPGVRAVLNGALIDVAQAWATEKKTSRSLPPGSAIPAAVPPTADSAATPASPAPTEGPG